MTAPGNSPRRSLRRCTDQFTTNFHWHDWEVLHAFVDTSTDTDDPQLCVASSHSGRVPNNEFLDPDPERPPRILSELGSHSSALSLNDVVDQFRRLPLDATFADITNGTIEGIEDAIAEPPRINTLVAGVTDNVCCSCLPVIATHGGGEHR